MMDEDAFYYLDLDYLSEYCSIKAFVKVEPEEPLEVDESDYEQDEDEVPQTITTGIDVFKYEIIKMCLDKLLFTNENKDTDTDFLLKKDDESTASYSLAFNTLLMNKIIKKYER